MCLAERRGKMSVLELSCLLLIAIGFAHSDGKSRRKLLELLLLKWQKTETWFINLSVMHLLAANVNIYVLQMIMLFFETFCLTCLVVLNSWLYKKEVISNYGSTYLSEHEIGWLNYRCQSYQQTTTVSLSREEDRLML